MENNSMTNSEIREALESMSVSTARGRAELLGQAIEIGPKPCEIEAATKARADGYIDLYRRMGELVQNQRAGIERDELEAVEWIREKFLVMARNVYIDLAMKG